MKWWDWMPWSSLFELMSFQPAFSLSSFVFLKRFFSSSSLLAIRMVSSAYLRLLIFLEGEFSASFFTLLFCFPQEALGCWFFSKVSFQPAFSLSSFVFLKRLFSSSSLLAIRMVSSAYLRLLIFLEGSSIVIYPSCKLNKQGDNIQPWCTVFPVWNQFIVPHPVLLFLELHTVFSWNK